MVVDEWSKTTMVMSDWLIDDWLYNDWPMVDGSWLLGFLMVILTHYWFSSRWVEPQNLIQFAHSDHLRIWFIANLSTLPLEVETLKQTDPAGILTQHVEETNSAKLRCVVVHLVGAGVWCVASPRSRPFCISTPVGSGADGCLGLLSHTIGRGLLISVQANRGDFLGPRNNNME